MVEFRSKISDKGPMIKTENLLRKLKLLTLYLNQETVSSQELSTITETQIQACDQLYSISGEVRKNITRYKTDIDKAKLADRSAWEKFDTSRKDYEENFTNLLMQTSISDFFSTKKFDVSKIRQNQSIKKKEAKYYSDSKNFTLARKNYTAILDKGSSGYNNRKDTQLRGVGQVYLLAYDQFIDQSLNNFILKVYSIQTAKHKSHEENILDLTQTTASLDTENYFLKFKLETCKNDHSMGPIDPDQCKSFLSRMTQVSEFTVSQGDSFLYEGDSQPRSNWNDQKCMAV